MIDKVSADEAFDDQYEVTDEAGDSLAPAAKRPRLDDDAAADDGNSENAAASVYDFAAAESRRCNLCGEEFGAAWSLTVHKRTKHPLDRSHHCRTCNKDFATTLDLEQHTLVHQVRYRIIQAYT